MRVLADSGDAERVDLGADPDDQDVVLQVEEGPRAGRVLSHTSVKAQCYYQRVCSAHLDDSA